MIPVVCQGYGGQLFLVKGGQIDIVNRSLDAQANATFVDYVGIYDADSSATTNLMLSIFGGRSSWFPGSYANHKPMAFSTRGRLIQALNLISDGGSTLYIGGWDGSGLFRHGGGNFSAFPWKAGVGWDAVGPSGGHSVATRDLALIRHNNVVFGYGYHINSDTNPASSNWNNKMGWHFEFVGLSDLSTNDPRRTYRVFSIDENDKRIMGPVTRFQPDALNREHLNACDAYSFKNDVFYANWIDVLKFPGGSGTPQVVYHDRVNPTARAFIGWPSGGFDSNSQPLGENRLLMIEGDARIYRLKTSASGRDLLVDLTDLKTGEDGRGNDNILTRIGSSTLEPGRPPLMLSYNNELHAFAITATSGYMHMTCNGSPSGTGNWTNRTDQLPPQLQKNDGCIYGFTDTVRGKIYVMHVAYSKFGLFGTQGGGQNSGGGYWLYQLKANRTWEEIARGMAGPPFRGLIPYQNLGPWASVPSGGNPEVFKCSDYTVLTYKLFDQTARTVNVDIEYSIDAGASWNTARRFKTYDTKELLGSGLANLPTAPAPEGLEYTFFWDHVNDVGFDTNKEALLRIRPRLVR